MAIPSAFQKNLKSLETPVKALAFGKPPAAVAFSSPCIDSPRRRAWSSHADSIWKIITAQDRAVGKADFAKQSDEKFVFQPFPHKTDLSAILYPH